MDAAAQLRRCVQGAGGWVPSKPATEARTLAGEAPEHGAGPFHPLAEERVQATFPTGNQVVGLGPALRLDIYGVTALPDPYRVVAPHAKVRSADREVGEPRVSCRIYQSP